MGRMPFLTSNQQRQSTKGSFVLLQPNRISTVLKLDKSGCGVVCWQGLMVLLQGLPTEDWTDEEVGLVLADAYRLKFMFADAPKHLGDAAL